MIKRVSSIVILLHLFFIVLLLFTPQHSPIKKSHHVKVRTVAPKTIAKTSSRPVSRERSSAQQASQMARPSPTVKKNTSTSPNPSTQRPQTTSQLPKKQTTSKKPAVIEKGKPIKKKEPRPPAPVWDEIDQALAKIETKSYSKEKLPLNLPQPLTFSAPASAMEVDEIGDDSTESLLMGFLHDTLHLPEIGEVKIQLTVEKDGKVSKVVVMNAESQKNKRYLQENLPHLQLPIVLEQRKIWTLTFYNEI